jgi:hypothetical protein
MRPLAKLLYIPMLGWSSLHLNILLRQSDFSSFVDSSLTASELMIVVHVAVVLLGCLTVTHLLIVWYGSRSWKVLGKALHVVTRREVVLVSALSVVSGLSTPSISNSREGSLPISSVLKPGFALAIVRRLLQEQRGRLKLLNPTDRLTQRSLQQVYELRQFAVEAHRNGILPQEMSDDEMERQIDTLIETESSSISATKSWDVVVRLYGHPTVENRTGYRAEFGKKRSVEVLAWLGMNMDRPRRSAVRTAVWDVEISDASFSTVMSDIRRGLSCIATEIDRTAIFPPTFTDSIDVGVGLVTDFDLLHQALLKFREDKGQVSVLAAELRLIRDIPFAGVNYMWADLDGTTTRLVMLAIQATTELAEWARSNNDFEMCEVAVKAGLRVMPGQEELLAIQHSFISQRSMSQG